MDSQPVEKNVSAEQIEAVVRESAALAAALRAARTVRLALFLALVVVVVGIAWAFYQKYHQLTSQKNLDKVLELAQKRFDERQDHYLRQVQGLVDKVSPPITKAFTAQANKDMPKFLQVVEKERGPFVEELEKKFDGRLQKHYDAKLRPRFEKALKKEFPDEMHGAVLANIDLATKRLFKKYYVDDLRDELLMAYNTWDTFPVAGPPSKDLSSEDHLQAALLDLLKHKLMHPRQ